jgi:hypothetical protein
MDAVEGEDNHNDEVGDEEGGVEGVPAVEMLEGVVGVVGLEVMAEALRGQQEGQRLDAEWGQR